MKRCEDCECRTLWYSGLWIINPHVIFMIYDLFTRADFCYSNLSIFNVIVWFLGLIWFSWNLNLFFFSRNRLKSIKSFLLKWHYDNVKSSHLNMIKGSYILICGRFFIILGRNVWGLFPYVFGVTTQMVWTFRVAFIIWLSIVISRVEYRLIGFLSHLTPQGSPGYLAPILNLIELVRNIIRPLTLALRLGINMTTGHVLISLMSTSARLCLFSSIVLLAPLLILIRGYLMFEMGICFIQGFVFSLLKVQYLGEHT